MKRHPVADLHCDLLSYLSLDERRSAYDQVVRCSIPQLKAGHVIVQVLPVFTMTGPQSSQLGWMQTKLFKNLSSMYSGSFEIIHSIKQLHFNSSKKKIGIMLAFENASSFCDEKECFKDAWERLMEYEKKWAKIVYISMTWNTENRFGGGADTTVGLKDDGKRLLDFLHKKKIAIDVSHASDRLAHDIFAYIDRHKLDIPTMASHSNFRAVSSHQRNLPDEIAKEIFKRKGVIGLNVIEPFVGTVDKLAAHLEHGLGLRGEKQLCFGADFFFENDIPSIYENHFFPAYATSEHYPALIDFWKQKLTIGETVLQQISCGNIKKFLSTQILSS